VAVVVGERLLDTVVDGNVIPRVPQQDLLAVGVHDLDDRVLCPLGLAVRVSVAVVEPAQVPKDGFVGHQDEVAVLLDDEVVVVRVDQVARRLDALDFVEVVVEQHGFPHVRLVTGDNGRALELLLVVHVGVGARPVLLRSQMRHGRASQAPVQPGHTVRVDHHDVGERGVQITVALPGAHGHQEVRSLRRPAHGEEREVLLDAVEDVGGRRLCVRRDDFDVAVAVQIREQQVADGLPRLQFAGDGQRRVGAGGRGAHGDLTVLTADRVVHGVGVERWVHRSGAAARRERRQHRRRYWILSRGVAGNRQQQAEEGQSSVHGAPFAGRLRQEALWLRRTGAAVTEQTAARWVVAGKRGYSCRGGWRAVTGSLSRRRSVAPSRGRAPAGNRSVRFTSG